MPSSSLLSNPAVFPYSIKPIAICSVVLIPVIQCSLPYACMPAQLSHQVRSFGQQRCHMSTKHPLTPGPVNCPYNTVFGRPAISYVCYMHAMYNFSNKRWSPCLTHVRSLPSKITTQILNNSCEQFTPINESFPTEPVFTAKQQTCSACSAQVLQLGASISPQSCCFDKGADSCPLGCMLMLPGVVLVGCKRLLADSYDFCYLRKVCQRNGHHRVTVVTGCRLAGARVVCVVGS